MGKKKSFYKKSLKPFVSDNRVLLAALGGVAAGITIAGILGTERAREVVHTVEDSVKDFSSRLKQGLTHALPNDEESKSKKKTMEFEKERV